MPRLKPAPALLRPDMAEEWSVLQPHLQKAAGLLDISTVLKSDSGEQKQLARET